jgi:hypothetical protein
MAISQRRETFTFKLACRVDTLGIRLVQLGIETRLSTVEDVVSGDCYKNALRFFTRTRQVLRSSGIRRKSSLSIEFASIDVGPGGAIDYYVRMVGKNGFPHELAISDIQLFVPVRKNFIAGMGTMLSNGSPNQAASASNEDSQLIFPSLPYCF